ncbi:O-antigen ligase family protein [Budvicia diplopodorum]|uniref:O-antigen ligase family protein n=1 Tax=Budvicia diplopodorum TaxID=1119056 RepID=UPI00135CC21A|nr:O-antigen ligase family protein [Budvicia diplopodorum]
MFQPEHDYSPIYPIFMHIGKILIISSILYLYLSSANVKMNIAIFITLINIVINSYAFYEHFVLGIYRSELGTARATIAAYIISIIGSLALSTILASKNKYKFHIATISFLFSFSAIILTQTRAAIIAFPILILLTVLINKEISRIAIMKFLSVFLLLLLGLGFIFKSTLEIRYNDIKNDILLYQDSNSNSSLGARFAMFIVGIQTGSENVLGQSAETRTAEIKKIINNDKSLSGAEMYADVHLHNEVIDNFSLKGIFGVISLLALYLALIYRSFSTKLNTPMLIITLSTIIYGLSDVLFFSKEFTITLFLCLLMSLFFDSNTNRENMK